MLVEVPRAAIFFCFEPLTFGSASAKSNAACRCLCLGFRAPRCLAHAAQIDDLAAHVFFRNESIDTIFSPLLTGVGSCSSVFVARGRGLISAGSEPLPRGFVLSVSAARLSASRGL